MMKDPNRSRPGYKETKVGWIPEEWGEEAWERYLKELKEQHARKRRLIEILDGLDGKPIVKKRR